MTTLDPGGTTRHSLEWEAELAEHDHLQKLIEAADLDTPARMVLEISEEYGGVVGRLLNGDGVEAIVHTEESARLIEAALNALPLTLAEIRRLHGEVERLKAELATEEREHGQTIRDRDAHHEAADELAAIIGTLTGTDIGEHSNANDPWHNAIEAGESLIAAELREIIRAFKPPAAVDALGTDTADGAGTGEHPEWLINLVNAAVLAQEAEDECDWTPQGNCTEECAWCGWERLLEALPADVRDAAHRHLNRVPAASPAGSSTADEGDGRG